MEENYTKLKNILNKLFSSLNKEWIPNQLNEDGQNTLSEIQKNYEIPKELTYLYLGLKNREDHMIFGNFTFLGLTSINKYGKEMRQDHQEEYVDIAVSYIGMGHYWVISWHKDQRKYFIRMDGGSNTYDANDNYERYVKNKIDWNTLVTKKVKINQNGNLANILMDWKDLIHLLQSFDDVDTLSYNMNIGNYL